MDPYFDTTFFGWFTVLCSRISSWHRVELFPDEIQLIVMGLFALSASFLGVFLVLKRLTMMANALSHTMLLGVVISFIISTRGGALPYSPLYPSPTIVIAASLVVGFITGFLIEQLSRLRFLTEDASNGMVFSALFALGIVLLSLWSRNVRAGTELLMGDPDAVQVADIPIVFFTAVCTFSVGCPLIRGFSTAIFDHGFATMSGFRPALLNHLLLAQIALISVSAFRAVGFVMTISFFVLPPLIARLWIGSLRRLLTVSVAIGVGAVIIAVALGRHLLTVYYMPVSTGALAAVVLASWYAASVTLFWLKHRLGHPRNCPSFEMVVRR